MSKTIFLPQNFIGKADKEKLESFGGHTIARGRATRWHWTNKANGDDVFEIYHGGADEELAASVMRDREQDVFSANDGATYLIVTGALEHVMTELDRYFIRLHGELPDSFA